MTARDTLNNSDRHGLHHCAWAVIACLALLLAACSSRPAPKQWEVRSLAAMEQSEAAYMDGNDRVATLELQRARQQVARTGLPGELARLELRRCALQVASLDWQPCQAFEPLATATDTAARTYHAYLHGASLDAPKRALLPHTQQAVAAHDAVEPASIAAVTAIEEPLSRLLAASLLMRRAAQDSPALLALAVDTAAAQGWRRPLLAWLLRQAQWAEAHGDQALLAHTQLRIQIVERGGTPLPTPP